MDASQVPLHMLYTKIGQLAVENDLLRIELKKQQEKTRDAEEALNRAQAAAGTAK